MGKGKEMITLRELKEKAVSKQQQKLMGLALAYKRGDVPEDEVSDTVRDLAKSMSTAELEKFAGTKHKGLPDKVDEGYRDKQDASYTDRYATGGKDTADMQKRRKAAIQKAADRFKKTGSYTGKKESVEERYSGKQVKMAMGIASDPRYKQGNYTGAVNKIEKIAKGLSKHPSVASYLKKMNEDGHTDVDSSERMCKTVTEDAKEILEYLDGMEGEGSLPTWWTNKLATASKDMNSLRDYLVNPDDEKKDMKEYLEVGTDEIRKSYAKATPGQTNELATGTDRAIALGAIGATAYAAKKAKDRFDPVKVAKARQDRADKRKARQDAQDQIRQQNKARRERMRDRFKSKPARRPAG